eukprot:14766901-Alexandrium_andersonii.AAC.1
MLRPLLGPHGSRVEGLKRFQQCPLALALLRSIGSIRYPVRSVLGLRVNEYLPAGSRPLAA